MIIADVPGPLPFPTEEWAYQVFGWIVIIAYTVAYASIGMAVFGVIAFLVTHDGWWLWLTVPVTILVLFATGQGMFG